jgi:hypothetical protein
MINSPVTHVMAVAGEPVVLDPSLLDKPKKMA